MPSDKALKRIIPIYNAGSHLDKKYVGRIVMRNGKPFIYPQTENPMPKEGV